jgi:ABC-type lipoprotein release transport system permease subunit
MALGAMPGQIRRLFVRDGLRLLAAGAGLGLIGAMFTGRLMEGVLFNVGAFDLTILAMTGGVVGGATLLACWLPARRASRVEPMEALRKE